MKAMGNELWKWLYRKPPIIRYSVTEDQDIGPFLPHGLVHRVQFYQWHINPQGLRKWHHAAMMRRPDDLIYHCINDKHVAAGCQAMGMRAFHINQNLFVDERIYRIDRSVPKKYDAIYVARMHPQKRHELASQIPSCLLVGTASGKYARPEWRRKLPDLCPHATFFDFGNRTGINANEIHIQMSQARVGLCLSAVEGGMFVASEYLLNGLPVVTTGNRGGRNDWMDPEFTRVVPESSQAVAEAVQDLISRKISPEHVRAETMRRMSVHRERFCELVQGILDNQGAQDLYRRRFYEGFENKGGGWKHVDHIREEFHTATNGFAML